MPRTPDPEKHCETCGTAFVRKMTGGRLEDRSVFLRRRFCSLSCANTRGELTKGSHHWRARRHRLTACEACGERRALHVHHCDQDETNNEPANLQTLCKWCHNFWHATQKRLGLPIAGRMPGLLSLGSADGKTGLLG